MPFKDFFMANNFWVITIKNFRSSSQSHPFGVTLKLLCFMTIKKAYYKLEYIPAIFILF